MDGVNVSTANRGVFALLGFVLQAAGAVIVGTQIVMAMVWCSIQVYNQFFGM